MTAVTRTTSRPLLRPAAPRPGGEQFCLRKNEVPCDLEVAGNTDYGVTLGTRSCSVALLLPLVGTPQKLSFPISTKVLQPGGETTVGARELQLVFVFFRGSPKLGQTKSTRGRWGRLRQTHYRSQQFPFCFSSYLRYFPFCFRVTKKHCLAHSAWPGLPADRRLRRVDLLGGHGHLLAPCELLGADGEGRRVGRSRLRLGAEEDINSERGEKLWRKQTLAPCKGKATGQWSFAGPTSPLFGGFKRQLLGPF